MVTAIVLLNVERSRINTVAEQLADVPGVSEVYSVSGIYDLVAIIRVATNDDFAALVTDEMAAMDGITATHTMLAFRAFSRHDLESMFSVGQ